MSSLVAENKQVSPEQYVVAVNTEIARALADIKFSGTGDEAIKNAQLINHHIHQAIYEAPQSVNGVEITVAKKLDPGRKLGVGLMEGRRDFLGVIAKHSQFQKIVQPLPFLFTTGVYGSDERLAHGLSSDFFSLSIWGEGVPILSLDLGRALEPTFYFDEIDSIQLTNREDFSPQIDQFRDFEAGFKPQITPLKNYLNFRRFDSVQGNDENILVVYTHSLPGQLWQQEINFFGDRLKRGFIVNYSGSDSEALLLEIYDTRLKVGDPSKDAAFLYQQFIKNRLKNLTVYRGRKDIITRLAAVPPTNPFSTSID